MALTLCITGRQMGKTTSLVEFLVKHPTSVMLVHRTPERERIIEVFSLPPEVFTRIYTYDTGLEFFQFAKRIPGRTVLVDNLDLFLQRFFVGFQHIRATATAESFTPSSPTPSHSSSDGLY